MNEASNPSPTEGQTMNGEFEDTDYGVGLGWLIALVTIIVAVAAIIRFCPL